jgi:hypothetical protein
MAEQADKTGIDALHNAMGGLLDNQQKNLGFPVDGNSEEKPSTTLTYQVYGTLSARLKTDWTIFSGLTLNDVSLAVEAYAQSGGDSMYEDSCVAIISNA